MQCPYCQNTVQATAFECPACRLTFPRTNALVGALPRLTPVVADTLGLLKVAEQHKLIKRIGEIRHRFPQVIIQIVVHGFSAEHPFSMHAFWLFNAGNFAGDSHRGKDNHSLMIALDPHRKESAIVPGYGLESFLKNEALDHLLELAGPAWENACWSEGLSQVLDGLDRLLESSAMPDEVGIENGDF
jgi:hypothetical protein